MPLKRISDQRSKTIEGFYQEIVEEQKAVSWNKSGEAMLELVNELNKLFINETIWCLTSLYRLVLLSQDDNTCPWYVIIGCSGNREFQIEYLVPDNLKPWDGARVRGSATNLERAIEVIFTAMKNSGGWADSPTVQRIGKEKLLT